MGVGVRVREGKIDRRKQKAVARRMTTSHDESQREMDDNNPRRKPERDR